MQVVVTFDLDTKDEDYHSEDYLAVYDGLGKLGLKHWKDADKTKRRPSTTCLGKLDLSKLELAEDCTAKELYDGIRNVLVDAGAEVKRLFVGVLRDEDPGRTLWA